MKRPLAVMAAAAMLCSFAACEDYNTYESTGESSSEAVTTALTTTAATTAVTTTKKSVTTAATTVLSTSAETSAASSENETGTASVETTVNADSADSEFSAMKDKIEAAAVEFVSKEKNSNDAHTFETYLRFHDVKDDQFKKIQTLIVDKKTGKVLYLSLCDKEIPYASAIDSKDDEYHKKNSGELDARIDVKAYASDLSGEYDVYFGAKDKYGSYSVTKDMKGKELEELIQKYSDQTAQLSSIIDSSDSSFVYRVNKYDPLIYIPSSFS